MPSYSPKTIKNSNRSKIDHIVPLKEFESPLSTYSALNTNEFP